MNSLTSWIDEYIKRQHAALASVSSDAILHFIDILHDTWNNDHAIFAIGNGGSAANASHFAVDLGKGASDVATSRFRVMSLVDNSPWLTAIGNDFSYSDIFVRQLQNFARAGDLLICVSVGGNSQNLVCACEWARSHSVRTIALLGAKRGRLASLVDYSIVIEDTHLGRVEDVQMHILHMACYAFMECDTFRKSKP